MSLQNKISNAIAKRKLSLNKEGERYWYKFKLRITCLYWSRNLFDGYQIEVYDKVTGIHLDTVIYC